MNFGNVDKIKKWGRILLFIAISVISFIAGIAVKAAAKPQISDREFIKKAFIDYSNACNLTVQALSFYSVSCKNTIENLGADKYPDKLHALNNTWESTNEILQQQQSVIQSIWLVMTKELHIEGVKITPGK